MFLRNGVDWHSIFEFALGVGKAVGAEGLKFLLTHSPDYCWYRILTMGMLKSIWTALAR